jgi:uncharacterized protein YqgV (UPF0045/DUF77 family)
MEISAELTLSPLQDNYEELIKKFIIELRKSEFKVIENPLSTHIYGEYYSVMEFLKNAIASSIIGQEAVIINIKIIKGNRSGYVPSF